MAPNCTVSNQKNDMLLLASANRYNCQLKRINLSILKINMLGKAHFTSAALDDFIASSDKNQANEGDLTNFFLC